MREIVSLLHDALVNHTKRFLMSFYLIFTQAFAFNLIYYQYPNTLSEKYGLDQSGVSLYMLPLSIMSFVSTLFLGTFFDKIGRKIMLLTTYGITGILIIIIYQIEPLIGREVLVVLLFLFFSPAASSANLIASEIFPTSSRTIVLFIMFCISMLGGMCGVWVDQYLCAAFMTIAAGIIAFIICPNSENKTLEQIQKLP